MAFNFGPWFSPKQADPCSFLKSHEHCTPQEFMRQTEACHRKVDQEKARITHDTNRQAQVILNDLYHDFQS